MKPAKTKETCATGHTFDDIEQTVCACGTVTRLPLQPAPSPANIKTRAEERFIRAALRQVYGPTAWNENDRFVKAARAVARERGPKVSEPVPSPAARCATCSKPLGIGDGEHYCFACEPPKPKAASETPSQKNNRIYAEQHTEKPAKTEPVNGRVLLPAIGKPEAASDVCVCRHMPCPVYPCPCPCHRQGPHVPTDECDEAASEVLTEGRFRSLADCATGYLVRDDTTLDQMAQTETYFKKLLAHDAALRAELNLRTLERDGWEKIYKVAAKQRDAAETRVKTLRKTLVEIGGRAQGSATASLKDHFRERWRAIQRLADKALAETAAALKATP